MKESSGETLPSPKIATPSRPKVRGTNARTFHQERSAHHRYVYDHFSFEKKCRHSHHGRSYATVKLMTLLKGSFWFQWIIPHHLPGLGRTFWIQFYTTFLTAFIMFFKLNGHTFSKYLQKIDKRLFFYNFTVVGSRRYLYENNVLIAWLC